MGAPTCLICGIAAPTGTVEAAQRAPTSGNGPRLVGLGMLVFAGLVVFGVCATRSERAETGRRATPPPPPHSESGAWVACQDFVDRRLLAPRDAAYPFSSRGHVTPLGDGVYRVRAYVDAPNVFGARIRKPFDCTVQYKAATDSYSLDSLTLVP